MATTARHLKKPTSLLMVVLLCVIAHFFHLEKNIFEEIFFCEFIYIFSIGKSHLEHSVGAMGRCACPGDRVVLKISGCVPGLTYLLAGLPGPQKILMESKPRPFSQLRDN